MSNREFTKSNKPVTVFVKRGKKRLEGTRVEMSSTLVGAKKVQLLFHPTSWLPIRSLSNIISSQDVTGLQLRVAPLYLAEDSEERKIR